MRIRSLREKACKTQKEVADGVGVSEREYGHYETGYRLPKIETLIKLADYFNVTIDYLVGRSDEIK